MTTVPNLESLIYYIKCLTLFYIFQAILPHALLLARVPVLPVPRSRGPVRVRHGADGLGVGHGAAVRRMGGGVHDNAGHAGWENGFFSYA